MAQKQHRVVLVVEVKQGSGQWAPVACIPRRPFTVKRANDLLKELQLEYPFLKRPFYRERVRIEAYVPMWVATQAARHQAVGKEPKPKKRPLT